MTEPKLPDESNPHAKWLREAAKQIAAAGHNGWGNTCLFAADEIDALRSELTSALARAAEREVEIERIKRERDLIYKVKDLAINNQFDERQAANARAEAAEKDATRWAQSIKDGEFPVRHAGQWLYVSRVTGKIFIEDTPEQVIDAAIDAMVKP